MNQVTFDTEKLSVTIDGVELQAVKKFRFEQSEMNGIAEITVTFDASAINQTHYVERKRDEYSDMYKLYFRACSRSYYDNPNLRKCL